MTRNDQNKAFRELLKRDYRDIKAALRSEGLSLADLQRPSVLHGMVYISVAWICLIGLVALWLQQAWPFKLVAFIGFGFIGHALQLIMHEASHHSLLPGRDWNDLAGDLFAALPAGHTVESYRASHYLHHKFVNQDEDPTGFISRPSLSRNQVWLRLLSLLCGRPVLDLFLRTLRGERADSGVKRSGRETKIAKIERRRLLKVAAFHMPLLAVATALGHTYLWFAWHIALVSLSTFLDGLRVVIEHKAAADDPLGFHTRSHHIAAVLSWLIAPVFQYHWEHHVLPSVPHCQLRRLHRLLIQRGVRQAIPPKAGPFGAFYKAMLS